MGDSTNKRNYLGSRYNTWWALTAFSIVVLVEVVSNTNSGSRDKAQKWAISVPSVTLSLAALACIATSLARKRFVGTAVEGGLVVLCLGFWCAGLPSMMNPDNNVAVTTNGLNVYANTYFFSWGAFIASAALFGSYVREVVERKYENFKIKRNLMWLSLCVSSLIVMGSGSRIFKNPRGTLFFNMLDVDCSSSDFSSADYCKRTKLAVALGAVSAVISFIMLLFAHKFPTKAELIIGYIALVIWCVGVGYITFSSQARSPGTYVSNLYFSTWASFILALMLSSGTTSEAEGETFGEPEEAEPAATKEKEAEKEPEKEPEQEVEPEPEQEVTTEAEQNV